MHPTPRRSVETKITKREKIKDDERLANKKTLDDKLKKNITSITTPRNYIQKSSTADIYAQNKNKSTKLLNAPKKVTNLSNTKIVSPMSSLLKSTPSTATIQSVRSTISTARGPKTPRSITRKPEPRVIESARSIKIKRDLLTNVTVNSPISKRKSTEIESKTSHTAPRDERTEDIIERQRTKTRTLDENETKIFKENVVDNNSEMKNLSNKLSAKPKAFYVELDDEKKKSTNELKPNKQSDEEVSYEDDFESYESDFESDHSDDTAQRSTNTDTDNPESDAVHDEKSNSSDSGSKTESSSNSKETRDEERMLDSGNFDLRDPQRSAQRKPMDHIVEDTEDQIEKKVSLTDEGFQEMSSSSSKTVHVDVLDRPLFIDFTKSKNCRRKRRQAEMLQRRAKDLLSMITLHSMSYSLFELKPIPYDVYMTTFGRSNYTQAASQTFDDGVDNETQTEMIDNQNKWTQCPVEFSVSDVCITDTRNASKIKTDEDFLSKFTFLVAEAKDLDACKENVDDNYKTNPLRIYLEQKNGAGSDKMLPYDSYKLKFQENEYSIDRLRKFMKKTGRRVINILSSNQLTVTKFDIKSSKYSFSAGYSLVTPETIENMDLQFVKSSKITNTIFSETKSNLVFTVHKKITSGVLVEKSLICLWDLNMALKEPLKILVAVNEVALGKFRGGSDGILVAALEDGSIHLWDLSEAATWLPKEDEEEDKSNKLQEVQKLEHMTQAEIDREWNLKNSSVGVKKATIKCALQSSAFTSSARNMNEADQGHKVVGMEFLDDAKLDMGGGKKTVGQICTLQEHGILTIWSIIQQKSKCDSEDIGKAYWSKMRLEKSTEMYLSDHIDSLVFGSEINTIFNLSAAKRRLLRRKLEKNPVIEIVRPKSNASFDSGDTVNSMPTSAASRKTRNSAKITNDNCLKCNDLKTLTIDNVVNFLIAKNCGEVLHCTRSLSDFKVSRLGVTNDTSSIICLEISPHGLPYFLAATDSGTINLCSLIDSRVLLTLDCRNGPPVQEVERYQTDAKGRYIGTVSPKKSTSISDKQALIKSVHWLRSNPCSIVVISLDGAISEWQLDRSDICPSYRKQYHVVECKQANNYLSLVMADGNVEVHNLSHKQNLASTLHLFQKYVTLL